MGTEKVLGANWDRETVIILAVTFTYDRLGRQKVAQTFLSAHRYAYDPVTLALASETIIDPQNAVTNVITRTTDTLGRDTGFSLGDDYAVVYGYDDSGRFHSVSSTVASAKSEATYAYLAGSDLLTGYALADPVSSFEFQVSRTYETNRNLIASVENRHGTNLISRFDYANDSLARRTRRIDNMNVTNDFGYNLRSEVIGALMGTNTYSYAYDPIGNREWTRINANTNIYAANPLNQYTNIADGVIVEPEYDADGSAPSEARRFLQGESPCRVRTSHPLVPSVGTVEEESHPNDIV